MKIQDEHTLDYLINESDDKNLLVEAGAGAGKTHLLVERIVSQIKRGMRLKRIVAITFTNKAQSEMQDRLKKKLFEEYQKERNILIKQAIEDLPETKITTIHSFCHTLLKVKPIFVGLRVGKELIDEKEFNNRLSVYEKLSEGIRDFSNFSIYPDLTQNYNDFFLHQDYNYQERPSNGLLEERKRLEDQEEILSLFNNLMKDNIELYANYKRLIEVYLKTPSIKSLIPISNEINKDLSKDKKKIMVKKGDSSFTDILIQKILTTTKNALSLEYDLLIHAQRDFLNYTKKARKNDRPFITNDELLYYTKRAVEIEEVRRHFQDLYDIYYIDEFQDTDEIQSKIFFALASKNTGDLSCYDIRDLSLKDGSLFLVGDPKQSIYRFRGADLNNYEMIKQKMDEGENSLVYILTQTFRYHKGLGLEIDRFFQRGYGGNDPLLIISSHPKRDTPTDSLSHVYYPIFPEFNSEAFLIELEDELIKWGIDRDKATKLVEGYKEILINEMNKHEGHKGRLQREIMRRKAIEGKETEGRCLRNFLKSKREGLNDKFNLTSLRDNGSKLFKNEEIPDEFRDIVIDLILGLIKNHKIEGRDINYKDFLILTSKNDTASILSNAFRKRGLPVSAREKEYFNKNKCILNLYYILKYLLYKDQDALKRVAIIMGEDAEIKEPEGKVKALFDILSEERFLIPQALLEYLLKQYEFLSPTLDEIILFETFAELLREANPLTLSEMYLAMNDLLLEDTDEGFRPSSDEEAIRILNIHKAKGLQGNIVIIIGDKKGGGRLNNIFLDNKGYLIFNDINEKRQVDFTKSSMDEELINSLSDREINEEKLESMRLDYVALTRAREALFILDLNGIYEEMTEGISGEEFLIESIDIDGVYVPSMPKAIVPDSSHCKREGGIAIVAPSASYESRAFAREINRPHGKEYGTLIHKAISVMIKQYKSLGDINIPKALRIAIKDFIENERLSQRIVSEMLLGKISYEELLASEKTQEEIYIAIKDYSAPSLERLWKRLLKVLSNEYYTEVPFKITMSAKEYNNIFPTKKNPEKFLISGIIDLIIINDGFHIIDFKTNLSDGKDNFEEQLERDYHEQLLQYKVAISKLFNVSEEKITAHIWNVE